MAGQVGLPAVAAVIGLRELVWLGFVASCIILLCVVHHRQRSVHGSARSESPAVQQQAEEGSRMRNQAAAAFAAAIVLAAPAAAQVETSPDSVLQQPEIVVVAPDCTTPDIYYRKAREAARAAETAEDFQAAAKWWGEALAASRCISGPDPGREVIALASLGMAQLYTGADRSSAVNLNTALEALLESEAKKGRSAAQEQNLALVFALREALAAKLGEPTARTGSRILRGKVPETDKIGRRWESSHAILLRSSPGVKPCIPTLADQPKLEYPSGERTFDSVGAVVVRLGLAEDGKVISAAIAASAPAGNAFETPDMEQASAYRLNFTKRGCTLPRDVLVSFRFRTRRSG